MKIDPVKEANISVNAKGIGTVTEDMVRARAIELAQIDGRSAQEASTSDREQAKRELTGESELDANERALDAAPESERWDPLPGSTGHVVPVAPLDDEDDEGRGIAERLVDQGVLEAEHDQMVQSAKKDKGTRD